MALSALPSVVSSHQPARQRRGSSSTPSLLVGPKWKQNRGGGLFHASVTCRYAFGLHTGRGKHIACHFHAKCAQISHTGSPNSAPAVFRLEKRVPQMHIQLSEFRMYKTQDIMACETIDTISSYSPTPRLPGPDSLPQSLIIA